MKTVSQIIEELSLLVKDNPDILDYKVLAGEYYPIIVSDITINNQNETLTFWT